MIYDCIIEKYGLLLNIYTSYMKVFMEISNNLYTNCHLGETKSVHSLLRYR